MGVGASLVEKGNIHIFADMPRWEIQQRMRRKEVKAIGIDNREDAFSLQYKRGYFNDWKMMDKHKRNVYTKVDFWLDSTENNKPKLINRNTFFAGMEKAASSPFRVVPFFDPAPWGGKWMMEVCDLDRSKINFGWCFDCVPEENSLLLSVNNVEFEMPSVNLVYTKSKELLGEPVEARFGKEFPIRFDFLDTMDGGNLSVQVHPTTQFAIENFGLTYTQDESYYLMDAKEDAHVFLGVKTGVNNIEMLNELEKTQIEKEYIFDVEKYVNCIPAKKHDHFLIPAGTIHCSGKNSMVLEISSTPNIFTFKLWDWNRMGLDGKPRPVNITRGKEVIQWNRNTEYVHKQLVNQFTIVAEGNGWREEKTGLHPTEFIETRRHWFSTQVKHQTNNSVNVLNLVEGACVIVESPSNAFLPFILHYAETFIVPAAVEEYTIRPYGESEGKECATIKAYIKF
jgi:mannose-6-phosphate isomerase class I